MTNITKLELEVLRAIDKSEYGGVLLDAVWTFTIADNIDKEIVPSAKSIPGIVSSLVKKGLLVSEDDGEDAVVALTRKGVEAYFAELAVAGEAPIKKGVWEEEG